MSNNYQGMSLSGFQRRVYEALCRVPRGRVTSYALLARAVGCRSPRAVGQALRRNPHAPQVPCHRVIAAHGGIGGFQGARAGPALRRKLRLLAAEGVHFHNQRLADPSRLGPVPASSGRTAGVNLGGKQRG
ncbi:MAG: MGMT family protein [Kiritimatiellia bacterium]|nr:MGMT family protein [Lentisphaerota bacterium]